MAYATWNIGTSGITSTSKFGLTAGWWVKIPDSFPPIMHIDTTSVAIPTDGDYNGCVVTLIDTTTVGHVVHTDKRGVEEFVYGDKWFRLRSDPAISNQGAGKVERMETIIQLYYRDETEGGTIQT